MSKNRYKFIFGKRSLTLTTDKSNLFMEEVENLAKEKYEALREQMPTADDETIALLMAINSLFVQLSREQDFDKERQEWEKWTGPAVKRQEKAEKADKGGKHA